MPAMAQPAADAPRCPHQIKIGAPPPPGVALCDWLCFPREKAEVDSLRRDLVRLQREQFKRDGQVEVHVSNGNLPWWWLLFCTSICVPFQVTFGILSLVLVPAHVATIVGDEHKAKYLGSESPVAEVGTRAHMWLRFF